MRLTPYDLTPDKGAFVAEVIERTAPVKQRSNKVIPDAKMLRDIKTLNNAQLCQKYGIGKSTATRLRTEFGTPVKRPEWTDTMLINLYARRMSGFSCVELGKAMGVTDATIRKVLRENKERIEKLLKE